MFSELNVHCRDKCALKKAVIYLLSVMISSRYSRHSENREHNSTLKISGITVVLYFPSQHQMSLSPAIF